jgi:hypothetical protein
VVACIVLPGRQGGDVKLPARQVGAFSQMFIAWRMQSSCDGQQGLHEGGPLAAGGRVHTTCTNNI